MTQGNPRARKQRAFTRGWIYRDIPCVGFILTADLSVTSSGKPFRDETGPSEEDSQEQVSFKAICSSRTLSLSGRYLCWFRTPRRGQNQ